MIPVTVIVVSYNTKELLRRCVASLADCAQVIVVDNASADGSAEMVRSDFPAVTLIANSENVGFGRANNQGIAIRKHEVVLLLNSDAAAEPSAIKGLLSCLVDDVVAVGGGLTTNGELSPSAARKLTLPRLACEQLALEKLFPGSMFDRYWVKASSQTEVDQVMGACLMFRPVETFDERFFLYCEDTELCRRLSRHGKILYCPEQRFEHALGASSTGNRAFSVGLYNRGKELYFLIHHGRAAMIAAWMLNRLGALLRAPFKPMFWRVLFAPLTGPKVR